MSGRADNISDTGPRSGGALPIPRSPSTKQSELCTSCTNSWVSPAHIFQRTPFFIAFASRWSPGRSREAQATVDAPEAASRLAAIRASPPLSPGPTRKTVRHGVSDSCCRRISCATARPAFFIRSNSGGAFISIARIPDVSITRSKIGPCAMTRAPDGIGG